MATLLFCSLFPIPRSLLAQQPLVQTSDLQIITPALPSVTSASAAVVGNPGPASYYYWVVAKYSTGNAAPSPAAIVANAPNTLSATNYVQVSWQAVSGASSYDLLRTTSPQLPTTPAAIAVAAAVTATAYSDQGAALASYTLSTAPAGQTALEISPSGVECGSSSAGTGAAMQWLWSEVCGPDAPPANPSPMNDEFNSGSSINLSKWTWMQQGGGTDAVSMGYLVVTLPAYNGDYVQGFTQPVPATPYAFEVKCTTPIVSDNAVVAACGLGLYETSSTKGLYEWIENPKEGVNMPSLDAQAWVGNTFSKGVSVSLSQVTSSYEYLQVANNGTTLTFSTSQDGRAWTTIGTDTISDIFTTAPDKVGIFFLNDSATGFAAESFGVDFFRRTQ